MSEQAEAEIARLRLRAAAIQQVAAAVGSTLDLDEVLEVILERVTDVLDAERSTLFLMAEDGGRLVSKIAQGTGSEDAIFLRPGQGIAGLTAQRGEALRVADAYADHRFSDSWDLATGFVTRSILCVPMRNLHGRTIGVVEVLNKRSGSFSEDDEELLTALAGPAAVAVENAKLYTAALARTDELLQTKAGLERRVRELDALLEVEQEIARAGDLESMLDRVLRKIADVLDAEAGSVVLQQPPGPGDSALVFFAAVGPVADSVKRVRLEGGEGIVGWSARHREAVRVDDVASDDRHSRRVADEVGFPVRNELAAPLTDGETSIGAISVLNRRGDAPFSDHDLRLLTLVAGLIGREVVLQRERDEQVKQERLATVGRMLAGILHDLKGPMSVIHGYVQLMTRKDDPDERLRHAGVLLSQCSKISALITEVLSFARGESEVLIRKVYLDPFLRDLEETLGRELEGQAIELVVEARERGVAWFDETKLRRALHNLCRNAAEAMPGGGRLTVGVDRVQGDLAFRVVDTGDGVPPEIQDVLFDSFVTTGKEDGTGLGLAIVKRIVDDHGGTIHFRTRPGKGSTFVLRLPQKR